MTFPFILRSLGTVVSLGFKSGPGSGRAHTSTQGGFGLYAGFNVVAFVMIFFWVPGKPHVKNAKLLENSNAL
jgi:hypothetical protein